MARRDCRSRHKPGRTWSGAVWNRAADATAPIGMGRTTFIPNPTAQWGRFGRKPSGINGSAITDTPVEPGMPLR